MNLQTKLLYQHVWRPITFSLQTVIVADLKNLAYIRHCTQAKAASEKKRWSLHYQAIGNDVYVSITLRPSLHAYNFNPMIRLGLQNILTCLILTYTALQNKHFLTGGDYISGIEGMSHVQKQSLSKFLSTPTTGCLVLFIRCAESSTHIRPATSNSTTHS